MHAGECSVTLRGRMLYVVRQLAECSVYVVAVACDEYADAQVYNMHARTMQVTEVQVHGESRMHA